MMKLQKTKLLFLSLLLLFFLIGASFVLAQKPLEVAYPELPGVKTPTTTKEALPDYIRYIFQFSLFLAALISLGSFTYGGVRYLISAGSPAAQKDARSQMTAGVLGLTILIASFVILNTVNPQLTALKVSLFEGAERKLPAGPPRVSAATHVEIPLGGLIKNLWGTATSAPSRPVECYNFNANGDKIGNQVTQDRLECVKKLSEAIKIKAQKLKEPMEELRRFYDAANCCEDNCQNACDWVRCADDCQWNEDDGYWENCQNYSWCEGSAQREREGWGGCGAYTSCEGLSRDASKNWCRAAACDYFPACSASAPPASSCEAVPMAGASSICRDPGTKATCSYGDPIIQEKVNQVRTALLAFQVKMGFSPLSEALVKSENLDQLLSEESSKTLIKNLLLYQGPEYSQIDVEKLKKILKIKGVATYLIEEGNYRELLFSNENTAKTILKALGLLGNEMAINEIAWMGTTADSSQEWLELYNNTKGDINLTGWQIKAADGTPLIALSGTIPSQGFYILENSEEATDLPANLIFGGNLDNTGEALEIDDQFGNLVEKVSSQSGWFAGDEALAASMERVNSQEDSSNSKNWLTNLSTKVEEEQKKYLINGKDKSGNPIYGTPKKPNSAGVEMISYLSLDNLVSDLRRKLENEKEAMEKTILVLRKKENLERLMKTKEFLGQVLAGETERLKRLLQEREVLRMLLENRNNLDALLADPHTVAVFRRILDMEGPDKEATWQDLITNKLTEAIINSKLINEFQRDLLWVLDARDLMRDCEEDPLSIDQARVPDLIPNMKIEKVPEWEEIEIEVQFPGEDEPGHDPAIFYCQKPLW